MRSLSLSITIIPGIAILLDILLYVFLLRHTAEKKIFSRFVITTILWAFLFNVAWEILQIPLFKGRVYEWHHILFCVLASVADVIMVLIIYFGFALIYKNVLWVKNLKTNRIILLVLVGGAGAVLAEIKAFINRHMELCRRHAIDLCCTCGAFTGNTIHDFTNSYLQAFI